MSESTIEDDVQYYARKFATSVMLGFTLGHQRRDGGQEQKNF